MATLTWNPSATSSSDERDRGALAGRVGIEAEDDFAAKRFSSRAWAGVSAVPDEATTLVMPALDRLGEVEIPLDHHRVLGLD